MKGSKIKKQVYHEKVGDYVAPVGQEVLKLQHLERETGETVVRQAHVAVALGIDRAVNLSIITSNNH